MCSYHKAVNQEHTPLQEELRQSRPFGSRGQESAIALLRTADLLRRHLTRVSEPRYLLSQLDTSMEEAAEAGVAMLQPEDQLRLLEMLATIRADHR